MNEKIIKSDRGSVYYWISKVIDEEKDTLFFLHGLTGDHNLFEKQVEYFKTDYNIIAWDAPMHGKSRPYRDFSYPNAIEDMKQILDNNHIEKVILIGQSLGGYFSQSFVRSYPDRVKAFVSIDSTPYGEIYYSEAKIKDIFKGYYCLFNQFYEYKKPIATCKRDFEYVTEQITPFLNNEMSLTEKRLYELFFLCSVSFLEGVCNQEDRIFFSFIKLSRVNWYDSKKGSTFQIMINNSLKKEISKRQRRTLECCNDWYNEFCLIAEEYYQEDDFEKNVKEVIEQFLIDKKLYMTEEEFKTELFNKNFSQYTDLLARKYRDVKETDWDDE